MRTVWERSGIKVGVPHEPKESTDHVIEVLMEKPHSGYKVVITAYIDCVLASVIAYYSRNITVNLRCFGWENLVKKIAYSIPCYVLTRLCFSQIVRALYLCFHSRLRVSTEK